ncbi:MAG: hypothetical protein LRY36_00850 [Alphaproteobacteria bacterium]|nr:hypothetical protein [Alphaproteobacteria bacterium]
MSYDQGNVSAESFVIVGNWATEAGSLADIVNRRSGFNADCFAFIAHDAATRHGFSLHAVTDEGDTLIFRGPSSHVGLIKRDLGPRFSIADTDEENASRYLVAVESAAFDPSSSSDRGEQRAALDVYKPHLDA